MDRIEVKINGTKDNSYPILIGEGLLDKAYEHIHTCTQANKFLVVTNDTIFPYYGEKLKSESTEFLILPDGEIYKNMDVLSRILDKALSMKLERKDAIIALGGGVIGDMAGFASAIYLRGIDYIQIPTTLLAQVDSSVGGKVAVNHILGKNMIGSFYQPKLVLSDTSTLETLDERQFKTGLSEVLKYAFIEKSCLADCDFRFFEFLEEKRDYIFNKDPDTLKKLINICCKLKSSVVNKDEKEKGLRSILNFGHTYAHAIEKLTGYEKYTHGEAVSIGMKLIFDLAKNIDYISQEYYDSAVKLLCDYELTTYCLEQFDSDEFYEAMSSDKKVRDNKINLVMPIGYKKVDIKDNIDKKDVLFFSKQ